ncbi:bestrophin-like domain [Glacieibacterium frigidum]|uniref:DUF4239 domain-containing protein n=1 Tax=Glacieibacterium frigidum TaxID=2593303 RepID=A0A552UA44_9SPHN|nr:DUF4239 domain-containing protein [Glacieibacterium frigidum]TRW15082.1 DUF4239 domain-containing protein [Glacieibacterium frigidum]
MTLLDALPVWLTAALLFGLLVAICEGGAHIHRDRGEADQAEEGHLVGAALGLLALLLGFTFSLALGRFEERRELVVHEANAIGTVWLRADLLAPEPRAETRRLLISYADARLQLAAAGEDAQGVAAADARTEALQRDLWRVVTPAAAVMANAPLGAATVSDLTDMFDLADARHAALRTRIPTRVVVVLALYALISAGILGYTTQRGKLRHRLATTALLALLAMTIGMVLDLDRPRSGAIVVDQSPLEDVRAAMRAG